MRAAPARARAPVGNCNQNMMQQALARAAPLAAAARAPRRHVAHRAPRCTHAAAQSQATAATPPALPRRTLLASGLALPAAAALLHAPDARAAGFTGGRTEYAELLAAKLAETSLDYRACVRLLFNDVASGGHNGSVHFSDELSRPENADLVDTVAALAKIKAAMDAETGRPLSWTDLISAAARTRTKGAFDALLASKAAPGNEALIVKAYGNVFPLAPLGGVDAAEPGPSGGVPAGGVEAGAAAWRATFERLGLRPYELVLLGPDVICADAAAAEAMLRADATLAAALDDQESKKALLTRTSYEVPYGRAFEKLARTGLKLDKNAYKG